ncbi:protein kinase [Streptomyces sp. NPDC021080]|uniref:serine/threonine-protein kinase n=1 Tax=Streptomyces sp. NPDC021080 TaxID=3365110 RepID=UPI00379392CD
MLNEVLAGRFRIARLLGSGGMGRVWAAQDERMRRDVAVKVVHPQYGMDEAETQARFQREVQLAGRLAHQNIVTVHDWGEASVDGRPTLFLVMELVQGEPLHRRLKESTAGWPLAVGWVAQIAEALHAAHRQGVVHRDIKPANTLLTDEGMVKVLDFGVAKFMGETIGARELTVTGVPLGSPRYMSPEQAEGAREIDHRSDLYSLGCLLYHAVTGRPPFISDTQWAVLRMQIEDTAIAPAAVVEGLPVALNDLILQLLAKRPEDRPADAAAVCDTLSTLLADHAVTDPGGNILDTTQLGHSHSVSGQILKRAREQFQRTERNREEVERLCADALAESGSLVERARTDADELLAGARQDATAIRERAEELRERVTNEIEALHERARREVAESMKSAGDRCDALVKAAEEQLAEAQAKAEELVSKANSEAVKGRDAALKKAEKLLQVVEQKKAALVREAEELKSEIERATTQTSAEEARWAEEAYYQLFRQSIDGSFPTPRVLGDNIEATYGTALSPSTLKNLTDRFQNRFNAELEEDHIM